MKRILVFILSFLMLFSAVACKKPNSGANNNNQNQTNIERPTGKYILENGVTEYKIVVPSNKNESEKLATEELVALFFEATGVTLSVISDDGLTHNSANKFLSVGRTSLLESSGIEIDDNSKGVNCFQITTLDDTVYFIGGADNGVLYAVYEFLFRTLNFEQFSYDCYSLDKSVTDLELMEYDVVVSPDIPLYCAFTGYMGRDLGICLRMKAMRYYGDTRGTSPGGRNAHNTCYYIDPNIYNNPDLPETYHPEWFSGAGYSRMQMQLCYTAHGDNESLDLLVNTFAEVLKEQIKNQPDRYLWYITHMDNTICCTCETCNEYAEKYQCNTAQYIQFMNRIDDIIMDWFKNDEEGKRCWREDFAMGISFYEAYTDAPATYNEETGEYEPMDESVKLNPSMFASYAPIHANFLVPIDHPKNATYYNILKKITAVVENLCVWWYSTDFHGYMYPYDVFSSMQRSYQVLYEHGLKIMVDETQNGNYGGMTGWHMLSSYLSAQYAWDVYADQETLIDRFFKGYFLDAADEMRAFFENYRSFSELQKNGLCPGIGGIMYSIDNANYWPKAVLDEWETYVIVALEKIEKYKEINPEKYDMLYKHISMERLSIDYCYLKYYKANLGSKFEEVRDRFVADFRLNQVERWYEGDYYLETFASGLYTE